MDAEITAVRARQNSAVNWKHIAVGIWLVFSVGLASWWLIFGLQQINRMAQIAQAAKQDVPASESQTLELDSEVKRQHRMLLSEGLTLIVLLFGGGAALLYYIHIEITRAQRLRGFFAAFTHDIKTSLASLRLQAESLEEDLRNSGESRLARRLVKDTIRLELQLENSLLLAAPDSEKRMLIEAIEIVPLLESVAQYWPELECVIEGEATVFADTRAVESIFKNLLQNSVVHGRAGKITIDVHAEGAAWVKIRCIDDGRGFKGERENLGEMFLRHSSTSGSGLGLYLATQLAKGMGGDVQILEAASGFAVQVVLPAAREGARDNASRVRDG